MGNMEVYFWVCILTEGSTRKNRRARSFKTLYTRGSSKSHPNREWLSKSSQIDSLPLSGGQKGPVSLAGALWNTLQVWLANLREQEGLASTYSGRALASKVNLIFGL